MTLPNEKSKSETVDEEEEEEEVKAPILEESYPLIPPFSYAQIKTDPKTRRTMYHIIEVPLKKKESTAVDLIKEKLIENIDIIFGELELPTYRVRVLLCDIFCQDCCKNHE